MAINPPHPLVLSFWVFDRYWVLMPLVLAVLRYWLDCYWWNWYWKVLVLVKKSWFWLVVSLFFFRVLFLWASDRLSNSPIKLINYSNKWSQLTPRRNGYYWWRPRLQYLSILKSKSFGIGTCLIGTVGQNDF